MQFLRLMRDEQSAAGKIALGALVFGTVIVSMFALAFDFQEGTVYRASATSTADTFVTVLNIPPAWLEGPFEDPASATSTPTNTGNEVTWTARAEDNNDPHYFLLICADDQEPNPGDRGTPGGTPAPPSCEGEQWAVSAAATSGDWAVATYTAQESDDQRNNWWAWVCDDSPGSPRCNETSRQFDPDLPLGADEPSASPFMVNKRPVFTAVSEDAPPTDPGATTTWTAIAQDSNNAVFEYNIQLLVCKEDNFDPVTGCGGEGAWCESGLVGSNPSCSYGLESPKPSGTWDAYAFVRDEHDHAAIEGGGSAQRDSVGLQVANVAPTIENMVMLNHTGAPEDYTLEVSGGTTTGFMVEFDVRDDNSCMQLDGSSDEIISAVMNIYRADGTTGGAGSCEIAGDYNANSCYPEAAPEFVPVCAQVGTCTGFDDAAVEWRCTFDLWFVADPTDAGSQFPDDKWFVQVQAEDKDSATSTLDEIPSGDARDLMQFMAFALTEPAITYGALEPAQNTGTLSTSTEIVALGNTGINQRLAGTGMCAGFDGTCPGNPVDTIPAEEQQYATSTLAYGDGTSLTESLVQFNLKVPKSTNPFSPQARNIFWGIAIPGDIGIAGDYEGENTFAGIVSEAADWPAP